MLCRSVASLDVPMPFSIAIIIISIGAAVSSCMKFGDDRDSTGFFVTMLPICDIFLRINWFVLAVLALSEDILITFYGCVGLLVWGMFINIVLWRRFFKFKYNMDENDRAFTTYCLNYPRTSNIIILLSYYLTFQAIRLSYCRFLGKK